MFLKILGSEKDEFDFLFSQIADGDEALAGERVFHATKVAEFRIVRERLAKNLRTAYWKKI